MPTKKKKKYNARFPPARIKKIMQSDEDVGKVAAAVPVLISKSLELFAEKLLRSANDVIERRGARTLTPSHLKRCVTTEPRFDFLKEIVADVPDLLGDFDADPGSAAAAASEDATAAAASDGASSNARKRGSVGGSDEASGKPKRQRLTRKKSTDVASRRKYMDDDDEDEEDEGDDDEVFAGSDEGDAAENGNASRLRGGLEGDEKSSGERLSPSSLPDTTYPSSSSSSAKDKSDKSKTPSRRRPSLGRSVSLFTANTTNGAAASTNGSGPAPPTFTLSFPPVDLSAAAAAAPNSGIGAAKGPGKFSMSSILGTSSSSAPSTPLLKAALTSAPLGPLGPSPAVTSTTAPAAAAEASVTLSSEAAPSGNLEIDIDEDYDA